MDGRALQLGALARRLLRALPPLALAGVALAFASFAGPEGDGGGGRAPLPVVYQTETRDCGPAALAMLLATRERPVPLGAVKARLSYREGGASLEALISAASSLGMRLVAYRLDLVALRAAPLPAIALVEPDHYVVVDSVQGNEVGVRDPARGRLRLDRGRFMEMWGGVALVEGSR